MISDRLKALRKSTKKTQKEVAFDIGMSERNYSDLENSRFDPNVRSLISLAQYFNVTTDYILGLTDNIDNDNKIALNEITTIREVSEEHDIPIPTLKVWVRSGTLIEGVDYKSMGGKAPILLTPSGVKKLLNKRK